MTNMEYYRERIKKILNANGRLAAVVINKEPCKCNELSCCECLFGTKGGSCENKKLLWLMAEHKEEPMLTKREYYLVQLLPDGWVARDSDSILYWYDTNPKKVSDSWDNGIGNCEELTWLGPALEFIHWDNTGPWSVEELRKLKVKEDEPKED